MTIHWHIIVRDGAPVLVWGKPSRRRQCERCEGDGGKRRWVTEHYFTCDARRVSRVLCDRCAAAVA